MFSIPTLLCSVGFQPEMALVMHLVYSGKEMAFRVQTKIHLKSKFLYTAQSITVQTQTFQISLIYAFFGSQSKIIQNTKKLLQIMNAL